MSCLVVMASVLMPRTFVEQVMGVILFGPRLPICSKIKDDGAPTGTGVVEDAMFDFRDAAQS
jgi:hypothetical protein